ncbi:hypothetical protein ACRQFN_02415 [Actinotignum sp. GS-2025e]|uniref:hypothetical protein n=1 Tax=Actinotignum sp. GS-2025e TaxID=3427278 RepID=UPI003F462175
MTEEDILAFLREHGIEAGANYLVVRKYRSFLGGIGKLLVSNLWNAIDAAVIRVLVVTDAEFIVINPEGKSGLSNISRADGERFRRYPWESVIDFHVERKATTALIGLIDKWWVLYREFALSYQRKVGLIEVGHLNKLASLTSVA